MKKYILTALVLVLGVSLYMVPQVTGDVALTKSFTVSQLIVEINKALTILNGVLDSNNDIDGTAIGDNTITATQIASNAVGISELNVGTGATQVAASDMPDEDLGDVSIASGVYTVDAVGSTAAATIESGAALGTTATQPGDDWTNTVSGVAAATIESGAALGTTSLQQGTSLAITNIVGPFVLSYPTITSLVVEVSAQISDLDGTAMARGGFAHVWTSETSAQSDPTTNNVASIAIRNGSGSLIWEFLANGYYQAVIPSDGLLEFDVTYTAARTSDFINVSIGGAIESSTVLELKP